MTTRSSRAMQRAAVAAVGTAAAAASAYIIYTTHQKALAKKRAKKAGTAKSVSPLVTKAETSKYLKKLFKILFQSGGIKLVAVACLALVRTGLLNYQGQLQGNLFKSAFLKQVSPFLRLLLENVVICVATSTVESTSKHVLDMLDIQWRDLLTNRLHRKYFANMAYYQMSYVDRRIGNPEQHICEDVAKLSTGLAGLTGELTVGVVDAVFYSIRLWQYCGTNTYTFALVAYVLAAGALTTAIAPRFGGLIKRTQELEGQYSQLHERLRANVEPIALLGGMQCEAAPVTGAFDAVVKHTRRVLSAQLQSGIATDFFLKYLGATAAVVLIIGPFFSGRMKPNPTLEGRAQMLSDMRYHTSVIISMFSALGTLATSSRKWMRLSGYSSRLCAMERVLQDIDESATSLACQEDDNTSGMKRIGSRIAAHVDEISFESATVVTPAGNVLVKDLTLRVPAGTNLLVTGPNGAGKSSLFRVLGGLWPLHDGVIRKPGTAQEDGLSHHIFYVPQRPYVMAGTLLEQLIYPLTVDRQAVAMTTEQALELLTSVDLQHLMTRYGANTVVQWNEVLSLGEQQRLGMARLMYHKPRYAILDECTSGVTMDMEERFTRILKSLGSTCITISHRPALVAFHDLVLALDGEGGWQVLQGQRQRLGSAAPGAQLAGVAASGAERGSDAAVVNSAMSLAAGTGEGEGTVTRTVVREVLPAPHMTMRDSATAAIHRNAMTACLAPVLEPSRQPRATNMKQWNLVLDVIFSGQRQPQALAFASIGFIVLLRTLLQDRIARLNGRIVDHVLQQDRPAFMRQVGLSVLQSVGSAILAPTLRYATDALALDWRKRLTDRVLGHYLQGNTAHSTAHLAGMADADQRLTRDVERLSTELAQLVPTLVKPVFDIVWFTWQMAQLTGVQGVGALYGYMLLGYVSLRVMSPDFAALAARTLELESLFRKSHHYLRQHAESVAFFGGGAREGGTISRHLASLLAQLRRLSSARWLHSIVDELFTKQLPHNATWALTLLFALQRDGSAWVDSQAQGATVYQMRYLATVVANCFLAFGEILGMHTRLYQLTGGVSRVSQLLSVTAAAEALQGKLALSNIAGTASQVGDESALVELDSVAVVTPQGNTLAKHVSLRLMPQRNLLVTGPNGSGKSSIFRILRGLWPLVRGCISVEGGPAKWKLCSSVFYVPQLPYLGHGTLLHQIVYPLSLEEALVRWGLPRGKIVGKADALKKLRAHCDELMDVVRLSYLINREGGWEATALWGTVLSLGEQQRMGMARLFYHQPKLAILDECTNATSVDVEQKLYEHARALGITIITVTQRPALVRHHHQELRLLDGEGHWQLCDLETQ